MDLARSPHAPRHRAPRRPGRVGRAALAAVAVGAPVVPTVLLAAPAHADTDWDALARCESGGDWAINTGNGFSGGLQFTPSTWRAFGGSGNAEDASRSEQIAVAERVKAAQGMTAWPTCSRRTGQTDSSPNSGSSGSSSDDSGSSRRSSSSDDSGSSRHSGSSHRSGSSDDADSSVRRASTHSSTGSYTVRAGDTLSSIAASQGTTWRAIAQGNPDVLSDPNLIFPGQTLSMS